MTVAPNQIFLANFHQLIVRSIYDIEESSEHNVIVQVSYEPLMEQVITVVWLGTHFYSHCMKPESCDSLTATFIACSAFDEVYPRTEDEYAKWHIK